MSLESDIIVVVDSIFEATTPIEDKEKITTLVFNTESFQQQITIEDTCINVSSQFMLDWHSTDRMSHALKHHFRLFVKHGDLLKQWKLQTTEQKSNVRSKFLFWCGFSVLFHWCSSDQLMLRTVQNLTPAPPSKTVMGGILVASLKPVIKYTATTTTATELSSTNSHALANH